MRRLATLVAGLAFLVSCSAAGKTFGDNGRTSTAAIQQMWYADSKWKLCLGPDCGTAVSGAGADALTYNSYFGYKPQHDDSYLPLIAKIADAMPRYDAPCRDRSCTTRSDVMMWDAIAFLRAYDGAPQGSTTLAQGEAALSSIDHSSAFATGACPAIWYRQAFGGGDKIKALATDSGYVKAALLVYHFNNDKRYLDLAERHYAAIRKYYFDPQAGLYTAYVVDDGKHCTQVPRRFLAGANGNMIYSAFLLGQFRSQQYRDQAIAGAQAVAKHLSDARGVYANLQDEDDIADPLFEAMYAIAFYWDQDFARDWLLRNAAVAIGARTASGSFGRFLDGPAPEDGVSAFQTNGGFAATLAAQALSPGEVPSPEPGWGDAKSVPLEVTKVPAVIKFTGSGIALRGELGDPCCPHGARVFVDGVETFDHTGIQQSISPAGKFPNAVLFAWQWPSSGPHEIRLEANAPGDAEHAIHLTGYQVR